jgi:hypothetical protein
MGDYDAPRTSHVVNRLHDTNLASWLKRMGLQIVEAAKAKQQPCNLAFAVFVASTLESSLQQLDS